VAWVFLCFSLFVGTVGSGLGAGLGYLIVRDINTVERWIQIIFGLKLWSSSVYVFSKIPNEIAWGWTLLVAILATVAAVIGAVVPAVIAARTSPVTVLRYE
jgi:lipoprotein-releasing system permease protein